LLLGVGYASCTAMHLAEYRYQEEPTQRSYRCVVRHRGEVQWRKYTDAVLDDSDFTAIGDALDEKITCRRGYIGNAEGRLMPMREVVDNAAEWMRTHRQ